MKRWVGVFLLIGLMLSSPVYGQTINVSVTDWTKLRTELLNSKVQLAILNSEVMNLDGALRQARESQVSSTTKISDLEIQLALAKEQQTRFLMQVASLEAQLAGLGISLTSTQFLLDRNEAKQIARIEALIAGYERRMVVKNIIIGTLLAVIVGGITYTFAVK